MSILNVARGGSFSSDRSMHQYCDNIWDVRPVEMPAWERLGGGQTTNPEESPDPLGLAGRKSLPIRRHQIY